MIYPPTPTPLPQGIPRFEMGDSYSLWEAAPTYLQVWNWSGIIGGVLQLVIFLVVIVVCAVVIYRQFQKVSELDSQS